MDSWIQALHTFHSRARQGWQAQGPGFMLTETNAPIAPAVSWNLGLRMNRQICARGCERRGRLAAVQHDIRFSSTHRYATLSGTRPWPVEIFSGNLIQEMNMVKKMPMMNAPLMFQHSSCRGKSKHRKGMRACMRAAF